MKTQVRVGYILSLFSAVVFIMNIIAIYIRHEQGDRILKIEYLFYFLVFCISLTSVYVPFRISRFVQPGIMAFCGSIITIAGESAGGVLFIVSAFLLAYNYELFAQNKPYKIISVVVFVFLVFLNSPSLINTNKYLSALAWTLLVSSFIFILWAIFKDSISKLREKEKSNNEKLIRLLEESKTATESALKLGREAIDELKRVYGGENDR